MPDDAHSLVLPCELRYNSSDASTASSRLVPHPASSTYEKAGADGKIYSIGEGGTVVVVSSGGEFKTISHFNVEGAGPPADLASNGEPKPGGSPESGPIRSTIAVANGHLFVRTSRSLYCIGEKR
ncbi:MAG: hypothetical protein ACLP9L_12765 [Thermoguttaceae bacterium]